MTLHSWGAIAPSVDNVDRLLSYIKTARPALMRWKKTQILIIDEGTATFFVVCACHGATFWLLVSMVDGHLFEKICEIAARLRKKTDRPFGGIQVGTGTSDLSDCKMMTTTLCSLSSLATSSSYPRSPNQANSLSSRSSVMHGKHALTTLSQ
jgi:hypothetical protein